MTEKELGKINDLYSAVCGYEIAIKCIREGRAGTNFISGIFLPKSECQALLKFAEERYKTLKAEFDALRVEEKKQ